MSMLACRRSIDLACHMSPSDPTTIKAQRCRHVLRPQGFAPHSYLTDRAFNNVAASLRLFTPDEALTALQLGT